VAGEPSVDMGVYEKILVKGILVKRGSLIYVRFQVLTAASMKYSLSSGMYCRVK